MAESNDITLTEVGNLIRKLLHDGQELKQDLQELKQDGQEFERDLQELKHNGQEHKRDFQKLKYYVRKFKLNVDEKFQEVEVKWEESIEQLEIKLSLQMTVLGKNISARLFNSRISNFTQELEMLYTSENISIVNFPENIQAITAISNLPDINRLLSQCHLSKDEDLQTRLRRFRAFIGLTDTV